jgi:hypothetical protein
MCIPRVGLTRPSRKMCLLCVRLRYRQYTETRETAGSKLVLGKSELLTTETSASTHLHTLSYARRLGKLRCT